MKDSINYYENAPIIVAILQFRYDKIINFDIELIKKIAKNIENDFPHVSPQYTQDIIINNNEDKTSVSLKDRKIQGIQIISKNRKEYFTISSEKFTFQSHEKYQGWDIYIGKVHAFWNSFSKILKVDKLTGVSLRYVNKFNLPIETKLLTKYFTTYLKDDVNNHAINNFQLRFSSFDKENKFNYHIGHALEKPIGETIPYLLDIDIQRNGDINNNDKEIWPLFDKIRMKKNQIFNDGITEETKKLIK